MGHRLPLHSGKCSNFHGHNYDVTITLDFETGQSFIEGVGFLIDFGDIKKYVDERFDHKFVMQSSDPYLKSIAPLEIPGLVVVDYAPTAENLATDISQGLKQYISTQGFSSNQFKVIVKLWETSNSFVTQIA